MNLPRETMGLLPLAVRILIKDLRRQRKAALRECGRLGDKLHVARLEIELLRYHVRELEATLRVSRQPEPHAAVSNSAEHVS